MTTNFSFYNKNAASIIYLSNLFMSMDIDDKVPIYDDLSHDMNVARGTVQNSIKILQMEGAIGLEAKGHQGTYLKSKDISKLLKFANIQYLLGAMSLPYAKTYEGLATGIITSLHNKYCLPVNMAYMSDAVERIDAMLQGRYDFVIVSKGSALKAIESKRNIEIVIDFGERTYLSANLLVFSNKKCKDVKDGMRVGIARDSLLHEECVRNVCIGKNVEYIKLEYNHILDAVKNSEIDFTVWHKNEIQDAELQINTIPHYINEMDSSAVLVIDHNRRELNKLLTEIIDVKRVTDIQQEVIADRMSPKY